MVAKASFDSVCLLKEIWFVFSVKVNCSAVKFSKTSIGFYDICEAEETEKFV